MSEKIDEELAELEDPENWDWDAAVVVQRPTAHEGAQVVVAVGHEDFQRIARCAEKRGEKLTDFFLVAALERAGRDERAEVGVASTSESRPG